MLGAYNDIIIADTVTACVGIDTSSTITVSSSNYTVGYDSFVGTNVLQEMLYDPDCVDIGCVSTYLPNLIRAAVSASVGICMAIFVLLFLLFISPCMCSRNCRRWKGWKQLGELKESRSSLSPRGEKFVWVLFVLLSIGTLTDIVLIARNDADMKSSLDQSFCQTFKFINETMNGGTVVVFEDDYGYSVEAQFPGLGSISDVVSTLTDLANPTSDVMKGLTELATDAKPIEAAYVDLLSTYNTLNTVMKANVKVNEHTCVFCTNFTSFPDASYYNHPNYQVMKALNSSLGKIITDVRHIVLPLVDDTVPALYQTLVDLEDSLNSFVDSLNSFINESLLGNMFLIKSIFTWFSVSVIILVVLSVGPAGMVYWALVYGSKKPAEVKPSVAPFMATCAYTFLIFLVSGLLLLAAYFSASTCLIFEDVGSVAAKISFRFSSSDTVSTSVSAIVAECLSKSTDGDILSGVIVNSDSTARDYIDAITTLAGEYNTLHTAAKNGITSSVLATNTHVVNLGTYLKSVGNFYLISPSDITTLSTSSSTLISSTKSAVWYYAMRSTPQCTDRSITIASTPTGVLNYLTDYTSSTTSTTYTIPGLNSVISKYSSNSISTGLSSCSTTYATSNLYPWGTIENMKLKIINYSSFRCDTSSTSTTTDGFYYGTSTSKTCSNSAYTTYMSTIATQSATKAGTLDTLVANNFDTLLNTVWDLIYDELLAPLQYLGEELNCQFISARWNALTAAMCSDFTPNLINLGKTMFAMGFMGFFFMIIQFIVWRHRIDNYYLWQDAHDDNAARAAGRVSTYSPARIQVTQSTNSDNPKTMSVIMQNI